MREVRYWVADDGEKFVDEEECREHEYTCRLKTVGNNLVALRNCGEPVEIVSHLEEIFLLRLANQEAVDLWGEINGYYGCSVAECDKPGFYYFEEMTGTWHNLDEDIHYLNEKKKILENFGA